MSPVYNKICIYKYWKDVDHVTWLWFVFLGSKKRKAAPAAGAGLALTAGLGVILLNIINFTEREQQARPLCDWWIKTETRPSITTSELRSNVNKGHTSPLLATRSDRCCFTEHSPSLLWSTLPRDQAYDAGHRVIPLPEDSESRANLAS